MTTAELMSLFLPLLTAHLIGDFLLQTGANLKRKAEFSRSAFVEHSALHAVLAYVMAGYWRAWLIPVAVFVIHGVIDVAAQLFLKTAEAGDRQSGSRRRLLLFVIDQVLHVASLMAITWYIGSRLEPGASSWSGVVGVQAAMVIGAGYVVTVMVGSTVIGMFVEPFLAEIANADKAEGDAEATRKRRRGLTGGGQMIGYLERSLIFLFVLVGTEAAVGFLIAAKSIFRFGELKDAQNRMEAEYIIIGTLMSFAWGILGSWLTFYALNMLPQ